MDTFLPADLPTLPSRPPNAHKGDFGTVVIAGGNLCMPGAPAIAARAALRAGAGLVRIALEPAPLMCALGIEPSATGILMRGEADLDARAIATSITHAGAIVAGPGWGLSDDRWHLLEALLQGSLPMVLDADALNLESTHVALRQLMMSRTAPMILTPHPGEARRLAHAFDTPPPGNDPATRQCAAEALAQAAGCVVLLKGAGTVITDGNQTFINTTGNPVLATAGSGDVLAGLIGALLAQSMDPLQATRLGAHLHGLAADLWAEQHGMRGLLARELADMLPYAMQQFAGSK